MTSGYLMGNTKRKMVKRNMSNVYYGDIPLCSNEDLEHHGIKGMKWGVRRYQNEDGSLTDAGKARYGGKTDYSSKDGSALRKIAKSSFMGQNHLRKWRVGHLERAIDKTKREDPDNKERLERQKGKLEAQKAANANREAYDRHTSTGKMVTQHLLMTPFLSENYRHARARGSGRLRSAFELGAGLFPVDTLLRYLGDKKAYGYLTSSGMDDGNAL